MLFADFLNYAMEQANITNYKLAKHLKISQTTVANWLDGKTEPREKKRAEVLWLFGVSEKDIETGYPKILYRGESDQKRKSPAPEGAELSPIKQEAWNLIQKMDEDTLRKFIATASIFINKDES